MKKKLMAGAITLLSVATLAACSNSSEGKDLISMKGDVITEHQFFEEVKNNPTAQQVLLNMTIQKVFEQQYGSEVTDKDVDDAVAEEQKKYGDSYNSVLQRAGMTPETRKAQIRTSKLVELAVKKAAESELTDEAYQKAFESYTPDVTAQIIRMDNEYKIRQKKFSKRQKPKVQILLSWQKTTLMMTRQKKMVEKSLLTLLLQSFQNKSRKQPLPWM